MSDTATVTNLPLCDLCKMTATEQLAYADARIGSGGWGYVCKQHFDYHRCELGTGKGQRLVLKEDG